MEVHYEKYLASLCVMIMLMCSVSWVRGGDVTAIGDPGMKRDGLRVAIEAWNQCNEVGQEAPDMGSPRQADCFDLLPHHSAPTSSLPCKCCLQFYASVPDFRLFCISKKK